jgi:hypothetical protein
MTRIFRGDAIITGKYAPKEGKILKSSIKSLQNLFGTINKNNYHTTREDFNARGEQSYQ